MYNMYNMHPHPLFFRIYLPYRSYIFYKTLQTMQINYINQNPSFLIQSAICDIRRESKAEKS